MKTKEEIEEILTFCIATSPDEKFPHPSIIANNTAIDVLLWVLEEPSPFGFIEKNLKESKNRIGRNN